MLFMADDWVSSPSTSTGNEEDGLALLPDHQLFLFPAISLDNSTGTGHCSARLLHLSLWLISMLDLLLALLAIPFNALLVPSAFFARPIPFRIRRSLSAIALSYALLAGILLAKKCFWLYSSLQGGAHCAPALSSVACKLQEFPVVFIYLHTLALPLALAIRMALGRWCQGPRQRAAIERKTEEGETEEKRSINNLFVFARPWPKDAVAGHSASKQVTIGSGVDRHHPAHPMPTNAAPSSSSSSPFVPLPYWLCSTQQILLIVTCLGMALLFTAFDQEPARRKVMANCSIALAIRQKGLAFALLSLILLSQLLQSLLWHFMTLPLPNKDNGHHNKKNARASLMAYLLLSCRDLFLAEAIGWTLVALLTGLSLVQQFVLVKPCTKCTRLAIELSLTTLPLLLSLLHPILSLLFIAPVRYSAQRFCPILNKLFPTQEPITPPLPRPFPTVRILITEH